MAISLADLLARDLTLEWYEGVAIVRGLCECCLLQAEEGNPAVPDFQDILIDQSGIVSTTRPGAASGDAVQRAARVFATLVAEPNVPSPLRLLVLTAVSSSPPFATLEDFHTALGRFERPGRPAQIQAVYSRWQASAVRGERRRGVAPVPRRPAKARTQEPSRWTRFWKQKGWLVALAAVAVVASAAAVWWLLATSPGEGGGVRRLPAAISRTAAAVASAVADSASEIGSRLGLVNPEPPPPLPEADSPVPAATASTRPSPRPALPVPLAATSGAVVSQPWLPRADASSPNAERLRAPWTDIVPGQSAPLASPTGTVYAATDPDLTPPVLLRPQLPTSPPPGVPESRLPIMELVLSETGEVLSVRLVAPGRGVQDSMLLSAAKTWIFSPATRNGVPVACRVQLRITLP